MQTLQIRREAVEQNDTLLAAQATLDLRIKELELAQKAVKEAEDINDIKLSTKMCVCILNLEALFFI